MAVIISSGTSTVSSGMILSSPSIISAGSVWVTSGGKVVSANVYSSGHENIYSGGIDSGASIYNYGSMRIALSGSAVNPCVASGGVINVDEGAVRSAVVLSRGLLNVSGRSSAAGITRGYAYNTVVSGGFLFVNQYATISGTQIGGSGYVSLCGIADSTTIGLSGCLIVSSGGKASNTVISSGGTIWVYSGGTANNNRVSAGGFMYISPSGFAYNNYISSGVELTVNHDGIVLSTTVYDGGRVLLYSGGFASETTLSSGTLVVNKSATADMVTLYNGGFVVFSSGATGSGIKENGGYVNVQSGASVQFQGHSFSANITHDATVHKYTVASAATVYSGGRLNVLSGGEATSVFANFSGTLNVSSGGRAMNTTVNNSGTLNLSSGGTAEYTLVNNGGTMNFYAGGRDHRTTVSGTLNVSSGGTASNTTVFGKANVFSDGVMSSATVSSGGTLNVSSGGSAVRTTTFGTMLVGYRGIASRVNVVSNGTLVVSLGGKVTGELSFASGGSASFQSGGILDFDITSRTSTTYSVALVKDLSLVTGTPTYTLTVKDDQTEASYVLAKNAAGFNKTISVVNAAGSTLGTLAVGSTSKIGGVDYALNLDSDSVLSVTVGSGSDVITGDITGETVDVSRGRRAVSANLYSAGILNVYSGGTADMTAVYSGGSLNVAGGSAQNTSVQSGGRMTVSSGGSAFNTGVSSGGSMEVAGPGSAMDVTMYGGSLSISSGSVFGLTMYGGSVENDFLVSSGTIAGGMLHVGAFGSVTNLLVSGGLVNVFRHGYFNGVVTESGVLRVASAAEIYDTTVESGGRIAGMIQVNRGGLTFGAGGILDFDITVAVPGGEALVTNYSLIGGTPDCVLTVSDTLEDGTYTLATGAAGFSETITVYSTDGFTVEYAGEITVGQTISVRGKDYSLELNGSTLSVVVAGGGEITGDITDEEISVSSGMFAHDVIINEQGILNIKDGGEVSNAFINYGGSLEVSSGGVGSGITVNQDGLLHVYSGGVATGIKENGGTVIIPDDYAPGTFLPNTITGLLLEDSYWLFATVHSGTVANMTTIEQNGTLIVYSGGVANHTPIYDGGSLILSGGTANQVFVSEGASFAMCGGSASEVFVYEGGTMVIKNGLAEGIETDGALHVSTGGSIIGFTMSGGTTVVEGTIEGGSIEGGTLEITNSGSVTGLTVSGGDVIAGNGGWFNGTVLDGGVVRTESTAVMNGVTVESGGKVTGNIQVNRGGLAFGTGGVLDFDITTLNNDSGVLVTNYSLISGTPECTLTVSDTQSNGTFMLATSAAGFDRTIVVQTDAGSLLGTITVGGEALSYGDKSYTLALSGTLLTVTVDTSVFTGDLINETKDITLGMRASSVNILSSGVLNVYARGTAEVTTVNSGGVFNLYNDGTANDTVVNSCGSMYVGNGGHVLSTVINDTGALFVEYGGVAVSTTIAADGGYMCVSNGGRAVDTVAEYTFLVYDGGSASNTTVKGKGWMDLGGSSINAIILSGGKLEIAEYESSAFAEATTIRDGGRMIVGNGTVRGAMIIEGGVMDVSGGTVYDIGVESTGILNVSGGEATLVRVNNGGAVVVGGGTVNGLSLIDGTADVNGTVKAGTVTGGTLRFADYGSGTELYVEGGEVDMADHGYFNGTVTGIGVVRIGSAVEVYNTTVRGGGRITGSIQVNSGGLTFGEGGVLNFDISDIRPGNDALVTNYSLIDGTPVCVLTVSGTQANGTYNLATSASGFDRTITVVNTANIFLDTLTVGSTSTIDGKDYTLNLTGSNLTLTVEGGGGSIITGDISNETVDVLDGMFASGVNILSGGVLNVSSGGSAEMTAVYSGGMMTVCLDGRADHTTINSGGTAYLYYNGVMSNTVINDYGFLALSDNGSAVNTTINNDGEIGVYSGGTVNSTTIQSDGLLILNSSGTANDTTMYNGSIFVSRGGIANNVTVYDGLLDITDKGTANNVTLSGGVLSVFSGGTVTNLDWTPCEGRIDIISGAHVTFVSGYSGVYYGENDRLMSHAEVMNFKTVSGRKTRMYVMSGGTANDTMLGNMGGIFVCSGGVANNTTLGDSFASMYISGGIADNITVNGGGTVIVSSGVVSGVTINSGGMNVNQGARAFDVTLNASSWMYLFGYANNIAVNSANLHVVGNGGYACNATICSGGNLGVSSGCSAIYTSVFDGGAATVFDGGIMRDFEVYAGGVVTAESGATLTGSMYLESGAAINAATGAIVSFDLSLALADGPALITDLSLITGAPTYTLSVAGVEMEGVYSLAGGASGFAGTISVYGLSGESYGSFGVGQTISVNETDYTLILNDSTLSVAVGSYTPPGPEPPTPDWIFFNGDFNGDGFDTLAVETPEQAGAQPALVTIYQNGEPWGLGLTLDPGWEVVGSGDFNADGKDDFLRVNTEGYVVGEMSNGNGTFTPQVLNLKSAGWDILGVGDFNGNGSDDVLIANPTGASDTVGLLGYWESGVTWTLINGYSAEWECVATGDFNNDGKCDMLWKNQFVGDGGLTYNAYCTWIVEDPVDWRMVSVANPKEWNFLCSGDFDGNGSHDIAMINNVGVVGIWGVSDGYLSSWSILSAVTNEWTLAGVADFNADGTDDIAWSNTDTGLTGYWQINNKELTTWANIAHIV